MTITLRPVAALAAAAVAFAAGCATTPAPADHDKLALDMVRNSFRDQGEAKLDRLDQDPVQQACSSATPPADALASKLEAEALAKINPPSQGRYLGDWKEGEKLAQNGSDHVMPRPFWASFSPSFQSPR